MEKDLLFNSLMSFIFSPPKLEIECMVRGSEELTKSLISLLKFRYKKKEVSEIKNIVLSSMKVEKKKIYKGNFSFSFLSSKENSLDEAISSSLKIKRGGLIVINKAENLSLSTIKEWINSIEKSSKVPIAICLNSFTKKEFFSLETPLIKIFEINLDMGHTISVDRIFEWFISGFTGIENPIIVSANI